MNSAGSYSCECPTGQYLQADGVSCGSSKPQGERGVGKGEGDKSVFKGRYKTRGSSGCNIPYIISVP